MSSIASNAKLARNPDIIDSEIDDEVVMMDIEKGNYYGLNDTASTIWQNLEDEPQSIDDLVKKITKEFDVSEKDCAADITPFVEKMLESKLLIEAEKS